MTNARKSRARHTREEELVDERNALLDVLNAIMFMAAPKDGLLAVDLKFYLGQPRHPVYALPVPEGILVKQDRDVHITSAPPRANNLLNPVGASTDRLFVTSEAKV